MAIPLGHLTVVKLHSTPIEMEILKYTSWMPMERTGPELPTIAGATFIRGGQIRREYIHRTEDYRGRKSPINSAIA